MSTATDSTLGSSSTTRIVSAGFDVGAAILTSVFIEPDGPGMPLPDAEPSLEVFDQPGHRVTRRSGVATLSPRGTIPSRPLTCSANAGPHAGSDSKDEQADHRP